VKTREMEKERGEVNGSVKGNASAQVQRFAQICITTQPSVGMFVQNSLISSKRLNIRLKYGATFGLAIINRNACSEFINFFKKRDFLIEVWSIFFRDNACTKFIYVFRKLDFLIEVWSNFFRGNHQ